MCLLVFVTLKIVTTVALCHCYKRPTWGILIKHISFFSQLPVLLRRNSPRHSSGHALQRRRGGVHRASVCLRVGARCSASCILEYPYHHWHGGSGEEQKNNITFSVLFLCPSDLTAGSEHFGSIFYPLKILFIY